MYRIQLERFEGPLDLLLQLIEKEELNISDVSLGHVTEQYLAYIDSQTDMPPEEVADFLVVAAKLILIKSRLLLPELFGPEEDDVAEDLTRQLAMYRLYVDAGVHLSAAFRSPKTCYARERLPRSDVVQFSPPPSLTAQQLMAVYRALLVELEAFVRPAPELITRAISLKERIGTLRALFAQGSEVNFQQVLGSAKNRMDVIVSFLALLELVKQRFVSAHQDHHGSSIVVSKAEHIETIETIAT